MTAAAATCPRVFEGDEAPPEVKSTRKTVAIGDLHGDFYRLVRLLEEHGILIPGTYAWNPHACNVDLVLIGDYVDWRGEPLEGDNERAAEGPRRVLELLLSLHRQTKDLREHFEDFDGYIHPLRGNHDQMMLDALRVFEFMDLDDLDKILKNAHHYIMLRKTMMTLGLTTHQAETIMKFLNWYVQGGKATIEGWGSLEAWRGAMEGDLGRFLREDLRLGVVVNRKLYAHSAPDLEEYWRPLPELFGVPADEKPRLEESFLWGRKLWGFDYYSGCRTSPYSQEDLERMLAGMDVDAVVVGHTPVTTQQEPHLAYEGRVINIDLHGIPGSQAYVDEYAVDPAKVRGTDSSCLTGLLRVIEAGESPAADDAAPPSPKTPGEQP